jgi:DNA-directed RNA polymerase sigma subunit (sigma70/sigma32)
MSPWSVVAERAVLSRSEVQEATIGMNEASEFAYLADAQLQALLYAVADTSARKKEKVIWEKYVLCDANTLREVAPEYGVSHERIRQIVNKWPSPRKIPKTP